MIEPGWTTSDLEQWIATLVDLQFWPYEEEEPEPPVTRKDARPSAAEFDLAPMRAQIDDDNDFLELSSLILELLEV